MNSMNYVGLDVHKKSISYCVRQLWRRLKWTKEWLPNLPHLRCMPTLPALKRSKEQQCVQKFIIPAATKPQIRAELSWIENAAVESISRFS